MKCSIMFQMAINLDPSRGDPLNFTVKGRTFRSWRYSHDHSRMDSRLLFTSSISLAISRFLLQFHTSTSLIAVKRPCAWIGFCLTCKLLWIKLIKHARPCYHRKIIYDMVVWCRPLQNILLPSWSWTPHPDILFLYTTAISSDDFFIC